VKDSFKNTRLCWTRRQVVEASGLSYKTIVNLEGRGLLRRCPVGVNVACYTDASVRALFGVETPPRKEAAGPSTALLQST
jgi:hypothetical protein